MPYYPNNVQKNSKTINYTQKKIIAYFSLVGRGSLLAHFDFYELNQRFLHILISTN